jgi:hypothetical protein
MAKLQFTTQYGGTPFNGDAVAKVGFDSVISIGGGPETYEIDEIIATYGIPGVVDFQGVAAGGFRSFTGRLAVLQGPKLLDTLSSGTPNLQLTSQFPDRFEVIFDVLLHSVDKPFVFLLGKGQGPGVLRSQPGLFLNVILVAGNSFGFPGPVIVANSIQMLHVHGVKLADSPSIQIGAVHT